LIPEVFWRAHAALARANRSELRLPHRQQKAEALQGRGTSDHAALIGWRPAAAATG
jgi:hypothetical protein